MSQTFPPVNRTILIKTKPPWEPRKGHVQPPWVEPAPQRDRPSWRTFELKRMSLFTTTSFQLNKGKLKDSLLNSRSIKLYIFCFTITLERWTIPGKKAFMAISRETPRNWLRTWPSCKARDRLFGVIFFPLEVINPGSVGRHLCLIALYWLKQNRIVALYSGLFPIPFGANSNLAGEWIQYFFTELKRKKNTLYN